MVPAQPNQSLIDGLACLQALATRGEPVGVRELSRELQVEPTRMSRLLGTLAYLGLAEQTTSRQYQPGPAMHVLSAQALKGSRLLQKAYPSLAELGRLNPKLTVALGVLWRDHVCYLYHGKPGLPFDPGVFHLDLYPAEKSTIGLILRAHRKEKLPKEMAAQLRQIQRDGFCYLRRSRNESSLAVPLGSPPIAGLALAGNYTRSQVPHLCAQLRDAAQFIEEKL